ncbi:hypothetical protein K435DRAFT_808986 [Dendrothele bispora CBS 962.96]|uniref:Uncharacterized protein n=1 Tax=Dendrothele bispora (strain CBS 962.96) TaxID=1314807 RepID=A0A4S8L0T9_DENBC|nr:hypothetical protein K435DRAFT_808986 [Dendrothele bispora CBS 962.96]
MLWGDRNSYAIFISVYVLSVVYVLLYGAYAVLFGISMFTVTHKKRDVKRIHFIAIIALFMIATLGFIFGCIEAVLAVKSRVLSNGLSSFRDLRLYYYSRLARLSLDYILRQTLSPILYWCYKIWGSKKKIIVFPICISIINNAFIEFNLKPISERCCEKR